MKRTLYLCTLLLFCSATTLRAEVGGYGGRGGPFIQYHGYSLAAFDLEVEGHPLVIGGVGLGSVAKHFRIGGGGGGGFLWNPSENVHFGLGYGGVVGEYSITYWCIARLLIGGGGYALAKVLTQTDTTTTVHKISSGGFILFHPAVHFEIPIHSWIKLSAAVGYFLPNVSKLHSVTLSVNVLFGKSS